MARGGEAPPGQPGGPGQWGHPGAIPKAAGAKAGARCHRWEQCGSPLPGTRQRPPHGHCPVVPRPQLFTAEVSPQTSSKRPAGRQGSAALGRARPAGAAGSAQVRGRGRPSPDPRSLLLLTEELHAARGPWWTLGLPVPDHCPSGSWLWPGPRVRTDGGLREDAEGSCEPWAVSIVF